MFEAVILAFAINGYASLRDLEKLCKYDGSLTPLFTTDLKHSA